MRHRTFARKLTGTLGALSLPLAAVAGVAACTVPAAPPLSCSVSVSPNRTLVNGTETVTVKTAPGAAITTNVRYLGTKGSLRGLKANAQGLARTSYSSGTRLGTVPVVVLVVRGSAARLCSTSFTVVSGSFTLTQKPFCAEGTAVVRAPAVAAVVTWHVPGVTKVTLSVDGPGIYDTYGPNGSQPFNFGCGGAVGSTETHNYTLRGTTPSGVIVVKTVSASAVVRDDGGGAGQAPPTG